MTVLAVYEITLNVPWHTYLRKVTRSADPERGPCLGRVRVHPRLTDTGLRPQDERETIIKVIVRGE